MKPLRIAWITEFPVEWLEIVADCIPFNLPKRHPMSWTRVLLSELASMQGLELHIYSLRKEYPKSTVIERGGVCFHLLKTPPWLRAGTAYWVDTVMLRRELLKIKPHLIHAWGTEAGAGIVASRLATPFLITLQGVLTWISKFSRLSVHQRINARLERKCLQRAQTVTVESSALRTFINKRYPHLDIRQIEHAPDWRYHRVERHPHQDVPSILVAGTACHHKGTDLVVAGLDQLSRRLEFKLVLAGDETENYERYLKLGSGNLRVKTTVRGRLSSAELEQEYGRCTILVHAARADNSPNVVKEAAVAGVPVVAANVGGIADNMLADKTGILFRPDNCEALVDAVNQALHHPLFAAGEVDRHSLDKLRARLSPKRMASSFMETYNCINASHLRT